jgi:transposase
MGWGNMKAYNWKRQNEVKPKEFDFLLKEAIRVIDETKAPWTAKHMGRPPYEAKTLVSICLLKVYFGMPYRDIEGLIRSNQTFKDILDLEVVPDHNTIQRAMEKIPMEYLKLLNGKLSIAFKKSDRTLPSMQLDLASDSSTNHGRR